MEFLRLQQNIRFFSQILNILGDLVRNICDCLPAAQAGRPSFRIACGAYFKRFAPASGLTALDVPSEGTSDPHSATSLNMVWRFQFEKHNSQGDTQHLVLIKLSERRFLSTFLITSFNSKTREELDPAKSYWSWN